MPTSLYNFQYVPLTGRLPGKSFVSQTEQAINGLAQYVYENSTNYEAVKAIAQKAEEDSSSALEYSEEALDKAQTALETVGRVYIKTTSAVDLDDYYDSELLLILSTESTNLPASISGYLTVMSSDTHDYCMQVYIGIDGSVYKRTATISDNTPTFGAWSETPITMSSLQTILADYAKVNASNVGVNAQTDNSVAWGNAIGGGEIASGEQRLITGGTVYPLSVDVDIADKRITNIEKLLQGNLYDYQTDTTSAYTKSVPAGAMPYAGLEKVGGKTIAWNQLVQNGDFDDSSVWSTNSAGTISISGHVATYTVVTPRSDAIIFGNFLGTIIGHKYYVSVILKYNNSLPGSNPWVGSGGYEGYNGTAVTSINQWKRISGVFDRTTNGGDDNFAIFPRTQNSSVGDTIGIQKCICVDLTLMFGSGNEPTAQQFETMFPSYWYSYNTGSLLSAGVTSVISKDSTNTTLQTYSVPAEVQALEGYGWSVSDTVYNYVDFERKLLVKNVGSRAYSSGDESDSTVITDGTTTYYPLTTAVETDISEYLTDDNLIQVESGGTLTFENSNGDDYRLPVPSEETYMIDLQEAINNG